MAGDAVTMSMHLDYLLGAAIFTAGLARASVLGFILFTRQRPTERSH